MQRIRFIVLFIHKYLLWLLTEEEAVVELGFTEAAADHSYGAVICCTVKVSPELQQLSLTGHVLSESLKTRP